MDDYSDVYKDALTENLLKAVNKSVKLVMEETRSFLDKDHSRRGSLLSFENELLDIEWNTTVGRSKSTYAEMAANKNITRDSKTFPDGSRVLRKNKRPNNAGRKSGIYENRSG